MRDFHKINPIIWSSSRFRSLSDDARFVLVYLISGPHQTSAGVCRLPDGYAIADLEWELGRYQKARQELQDVRLISFDAQEDTVFVHGWFRHNPPMNPKHHTGIVALLNRLASQEIWKVASEELDADLAADKQPAPAVPSPSEYQLGIRRKPPSKPC
jgi:hypothetical protein